MPAYVHECKNGHKFDVIRKLADYNEPSVCKCGEPAKRITVPTMISPDMQVWDRYISPVSGKLITSYKDRERDMKQHGCVDYDPGVKTETQKRLKQCDTALEKKVDATVDEIIEKMPARQKEKLDSELTSGADCSYERI